MIFGKHLNQLSSPQIKVATSAAAAATTTSNVCQGFAANIKWYILFDLNLCCGSGGDSCSNSGNNNNNNRKWKRKRNSSSSSSSNNNNNTNINSCFSMLCSRQKRMLVSPALAVHPPACT